MPLIKRAISPVAVSRRCLPDNVNKDELQCIANGTLANLIRQLSSLSQHAEHIVGEIAHEAMKLDHKSNLLQQRIERLMDKVEQQDANNEQASLGEIQMRKAFKSSMLVDQHTLDRATLPTALSEIYAKCDPPPNLDALNPYRDEPTNALSLYTNPSFFFDLWRKEMLKDCPDPRRRVKSPDANKSPKKKRRPPPQQHEATRSHMHRYASRPAAPMGALSFPEEYQAPQQLGLQLHRNVGYQPISQSPIVPPPGMSVRAPPMLIERNDARPSVSPPRETVKRDLPLPDMSLLAIDDDDDELPPPPPPLMHTSIVQHMASPPQSNIQYVPSDSQPVAPPPPPPPPPPLNLMSAPPPVSATATFAGSAKKTEEPKVSKPDPRNDLLAQIRSGFELKKTRRAEEEAEERAAAENDVAAILMRRMQHTMGNDDESQSSGDDGEWSD